MLAMPYLLLLTVGFLIYRGVKKNAEWKQQQDGDGRHLEAGDS